MMKNIAIAAGVICAGILLCIPAPGNAQAQEDDRPAGRDTLRITDVNAMEWDDRFRMGKKGTSSGKLLYRNADGALLFYVRFAPGWDAETRDRHYHDFHEWGYVLEGNFIIYEFISPAQHKGSLVNMHPGTWMDRPAYSIHGNRADAMQRQKVPPGSLQLLFAEGGKTVSLSPDSKMYSDDWRAVKQFTNAHFRHTATTEVMEWEEDAQLPGVNVKWLSDDWQGGFRARLLYAPPGWVHPRAQERTYFDKAQRFIYVLYGDMEILQSAGPDDAGRKITLGKDFFIDQPPGSIWQWGAGPVTESGCQWLEVTYAEGTRTGNGPIEEMKILR